MKPAIHSIPFALNRRLRTPLSTQLADNLRNAILSGYYKAGDVLPSYKQLARALKVSLRIPREAMSDLVARNLVNPRPRIGCEVLPKSSKIWNGHVRVIAPGDTFVTYFAAMMFERFRKTMTDKGWLVDLVTFSRTEHGKSDFSSLDDALTHPNDFVLMIYPTKGAVELLDQRKIRHLCFGRDATLSFDGAMSDVVRHVRRNRLKRVSLVEYTPYSEIHASLKKAGIAFESHVVSWKTGFGYLERIARDGYELTRRLLNVKRRSVPDLIFFTDDFVARGGFAAVLESHLKIPDDVQIITFANKGFAPFFPVELPRIEADPFDLAEKIADEVLRRIAGFPPRRVTTSIRYIP